MISRWRLIWTGGLLLILGAGVGLAVTTLGTRDETRLFAVFFAAPVALFGAFRIVQGILARAPSVPIFAPEVPPTRAQLASLRQAVPIFAVLFPVLTALNAYELYRLETGVVRSADVWGVVAVAYRYLGFWPAVLLIPLLGGGFMFAVWRRARRIRAELGRR